MLRLAASLEKASEHPLGAAIVECGHGKGPAAFQSNGIHLPVGKGVQGIVDGKRVAVGNAALMQRGRCFQRHTA